MKRIVAAYEQNGSVRIEMENDFGGKESLSLIGGQVLGFTSSTVTIQDKSLNGVVSRRVYDINSNSTRHL